MSNPTRNELAKIELYVHHEDLGCAVWISKQSPSKVAEALSICESACSALHCQLSSGEMQQRANEINTLKKRIKTQHEEISTSLQEQQLQREKEIQARFHKILADKDSETEKNRLKYNGERNVLKQQLVELEEEYKRQIEASVQEQQGKYERHVESTKATHATLIKEIEILQSTVMQVESAKTQLMGDMQAQILEKVECARAAMELKYAQEMTDTLQRVNTEKENELRQYQNETHDMKRKCEVDINIAKEVYESKLNLATSEIEQLKSQLSLQQNAIGDVKETFRHQADVERVATQQRIDTLQEQHTSRVEELHGFVKSYEAQLIQAQSQMNKAIEEKERVVMHCTERLQTMKEEQQQQMQQMNNEQRDFLSTLSGSQVKGVIGERYVDEVFAEMEIGVLTDVSRKQREGFADRFWRHDFHNASQIPGVRALVEIKHVNNLHSQQDIEKFNKDVKSGVEQNRINCAIMLSLTSRIHGSKQISLSFVDGIPVLRASRSINDSLSPMSLVRMAFLTVVEVWPYLASNKSRNEDLIIDTISTFLDSQLKRVDKLQPQIDFLEKTGAQMQKEASSLRKTRDDMSHDIASLKMQHPQLITNACHENNDKIDAMSALIEAIEVFKTRTTRKSYPKSLSDLDLNDAVSKCATTKMFDDAIATVRKSTKPGKKRARSNTETLAANKAIKTTKQSECSGANTDTM